jgi:hypothetical protein
MYKSTLMFIFAATLTGCASFYENQEAAFQQRVPQLVADCNNVFSGADRPASWDDGVRACKQLWDKQSLGLVEPETLKSYTAYQASRTDQALPTLVAPIPFGSFPHSVRQPIPQAD